VLWIQIRIDPHQIEMQDPDPHLDPHQLADDKPKMDIDQYELTGSVYL
jgi:hypothetical protein